MLTAKRVRFWYRVHKWTSLVCTAFLLMECLTGLPMIFGDEIFDLTHLNQTHVKPASLPMSVPYARLDDMVQATYRFYPGQKILNMSFDDDEPRIFVGMGPNFDPKPEEFHSLIFDARTGRLLEDSLKQPKPPQPKFDPMFYISYAHRSLFMNLPGRLFLGAMALTFLVALVSGALVYGPFMRRLDFGTVRLQRSRRLKWFDLHNLLGIVVLCWACVVGATGLMNDLEGPLFSLWRAQSMPPLLKPYRGKPLATPLSSIDGAVDAIHKALPNMEITSIGFPKPQMSSHHYIIWTHGKTEVTAHLFTPVLIDAETGQIVSAKGLPWYLRTLEVSRPLHFGDYGGMPLKIIWALFDVALITVLLSGIYLWLTRRKTLVEEELDRLVKVEEPSEETSPLGVLTR